MQLQDDATEMLRQAGLIVVDESPMLGKRVMDAALDVMRQVNDSIDARDARTRQLGDVEAGHAPGPRRLVVLSGDFQQISPVVQYADRQQRAAAWLVTNRVVEVWR